MKRKVYIETTIAGYLTARRNSDLVIAAHQALTVEWWANHRHRFDLYVSDIVLCEAARGDESAAAKRMVEQQDIDVLGLDERARELARVFIERRLIPATAVEDALHVAVATIEGMDFLLTWNCRHIANAEVAERLAGVCLELGYRMPILCTPEQLMGD
ncbi:MAG: DNA-binding protein [Bryobacterales bacterium]|nr:DNA-binding protein [Bryobacterales bacterium]